MLPVLVTGQSLSVSNDDEAMLRACQRYIKASVAVEESDHVIIVGSDGRHYHEGLFPSLPAVDSHDVVGDAESLHFSLEFPDLTRVRGDEAEVADIKLFHLLKVLK